MTEPLLLIGAGGHARSIIDILHTSESWHIYGLVGLPDQVNQQILGHRVIGCDNDLSAIYNRCQNAFLSVGHIGTSAQRLALVSLMNSLGFHIPTLISKNSYVSPYAHLGIGTLIGHGAIVNAGARIGDHCIINSNALIEHDVTVGDHTHVSTGTLVNGGVEIGSSCFIGSGSVIREGIRLPTQTVISAGKRIMGWPVREDLAI